MISGLLATNWNRAGRTKRETSSAPATSPQPGQHRNPIGNREGSSRFGWIASTTIASTSCISRMPSVTRPSTVSSSLLSESSLTTIIVLENADATPR